MAEYKKNKEKAARMNELASAHAASEDLVVDRLKVVTKLSHGHEDTLTGLAIKKDLDSASFLYT